MMELCFKGDGFNSYQKALPFLKPQTIRRDYGTQPVQLDWIENLNKKARCIKNEFIDEMKDLKIRLISVVYRRNRIKRKYSQALLKEQSDRNMRENRTIERFREDCDLIDSINGRLYGLHKMNSKNTGFRDPT